MILDRLQQAERYEALHPLFRRAYDFLRRADLPALPDGRHPVEGDLLYASIERREGRGRAGARSEYHRRYIDIQYAVAGVEVIGWRPLSSCRAPAEAYDGSRDVGFFSDPPETWCVVPAGTFVVFFPEDVHAPLAGDGPIHKVVMKIAV